MPRPPKPAGPDGTYGLDSAMLQRISRRIAADDSRDLGWRSEVVSLLTKVVSLLNTDTEQRLLRSARLENDKAVNNG
jgi:hypothetical protein